MSEGNLNEQEIAMFKSREISSSQIPEDTIHLFSTNEETKHYNATVINAKKTFGTKCIAIDKIMGKLKESEKQNYLNLVKEFKRKDTYGLDYVLELKIDVRYMLTINIDTSDGLVNGADGILRKIEFDDQNKIKTLFIQFDNPDVGLKAQENYNYIHDNCTPICICTKTFQFKKK